MIIPCGYELLHIYGPFSINWYGLCIVIGILVSTACIRRNRRFAYLGLEQHYTTMIIVAIVAGVVGGRALEIVSASDAYASSWHDIIAVWDGGFSILGSIIGVTIVVPFYLMHHAIPILPVLDLFSIYAPLLQSISRLGCLFAGCCYGVVTTLPFYVMYTNVNSIAPTHISMHPTQLYSSLFLLVIFLFMFFIAQYRYIKNGQLFSIYLVLAATERFIVDFLRAERISYVAGLSFYQCVALGIVGFVVVFQLYMWSVRNRL